MATGLIPITVTDPIIPIIIGLTAIMVEEAITCGEDMEGIIGKVAAGAAIMVSAVMAAVAGEGMVSAAMVAAAGRDMVSAVMVAAAFKADTVIVDIFVPATTVIILMLRPARKVVNPSGLIRTGNRRAADFIAMIPRVIIPM